MRETNRAEQKWMAVLHDEPDVLPEEGIMEQAARLHAEIIDCRPEEPVSLLTRENAFTLWWGQGERAEPADGYPPWSLPPARSGSAGHTGGHNSA